MSNQSDHTAPHRRLVRHTFLALLGWLLLIGGAAGWSLYAERTQMRNLVQDAAQAHLFEGCLKCHVSHGYRVGDISGGLGVVIPLAPYLAESDNARRKLLAAFLVIGLTGLLIIGLFYGRGRQRLREQLRYQENLRNSRDEWERTFDAIDDVITIFDRDMRVIRANRASSLISGMSPEAIKGKSCHELFRSSPLPCPDCPTLKQGKEGIKANGTLRHGNKIFAISCSPLTDKTGALTGFVHIAKDITDQRRLESRLRQAQKMEAIGTLAGGIAHDFNNILTPIIGFTELAMGKLPPDSSVGDDLKQVARAAGRARELVRQILTFSRKSDSKTQPLELEPIIKEALKLMRSTLPTTIEIRQNIATNCGIVMADPSQLHQVIMNLCTNAYHAMRESGGVLAVDLEKIKLQEDDARLIAAEMKPGPYLRLSVSDNGCGMERATMERMFEPYFTTKPASEGTGLGMAVVHGIVRQHGGKITAYSEPGQGTTIHVYLPELAIEELRQVDEDAPEAPLPLGRERILVVDDDKIIAAMLRHMLTHLGYKVGALSDPREALALIKDKPDEIDLLITDMTMPHITGAELASAAMAAAPALRVILCTGFSELINQEKSRELGIHAFLLKPVTIQHLARTVDRVLHESAPSAQEEQERR